MTVVAVATAGMVEGIRAEGVVGTSPPDSLLISASRRLASVVQSQRQTNSLCVHT